MHDKDIDDMVKRKVDDRRVRQKDASDRISHDGTITLRTRKVLFSMLNKGILRSFQGIISTGKEANVYVGVGKDGGEVAIKIYRSNIQTSKWMIGYIKGDPRFTRYHKGNTRELMTTWALKEYKNLDRAGKAGVACPHPMAVKENVLVMEFIGKDGTPARRLSDTGTLDDPVGALESILDGMRLLFNEARLIHADLSPFNLLVLDGGIHFIDFAQGVLVDHPNAKKYLVRDIGNILGYFTPVLPDWLNDRRVLESLVHDERLELS